MSYHLDAYKEHTKQVHQDEVKNFIELGDFNVQAAMEDQHIERKAALAVADLSFKIVKAAHRHDRAIVETQHRAEQGKLALSIQATQKQLAKEYSKQEKERKEDQKKAIKSMRKVDKTVSKKELEQQMALKNDQMYKEFVASLALKKEEEEYELKRRQHKEMDEIKASQMIVEQRKLEELYGKMGALLDTHQQTIYKDYVKKNYENTKKLLVDKQTAEQTLSQNMFDYFNTAVTDNHTKQQSQIQKYYEQRLALLMKEANKDMEATTKRERKFTIRTRATSSPSKKELPSPFDLQITLVKEKEIAVQYEQMRCTKAMQTTAWKHGHELQFMRDKHKAELDYYESIRKAILRDQSYQLELLKFHHSQKMELEEFFLQQLLKHLAFRNKTQVDLFENYQAIAGEYQLTQPRGANVEKLHEQHKALATKMDAQNEHNKERLIATSEQQGRSMMAKIEGLHAKHQEEENALQAKFSEEYRLLEAKTQEALEIAKVTHKLYIQLLKYF